MGWSVEGRRCFLARIFPLFFLVGGWRRPTARRRESDANGGGEGPREDEIQRAIGFKMIYGGTSNGREQVEIADDDKLDPHRSSLPHSTHRRAGKEGMADAHTEGCHVTGNLLSVCNAGDSSLASRHSWPPSCNFLWRLRQPYFPALLSFFSIQIPIFLVSPDLFCLRLVVGCSHPPSPGSRDAKPQFDRRAPACCKVRYPPTRFSRAGYLRRRPPPP
jgi:hypothetical protein